MQDNPKICICGGGHIAHSLAAGPDFSSRYFTEDILLGTRIIQNYTRKVGIATPTIDYFISEIGTAILKSCGSCK
jgi:hypothetical protein